MLIVQHRINSVKDLKGVDPSFGAEIDIRYHNNDLILAHDPFSHHLTEPETLDRFLESYTLHGPLILNIKTEGIEQRCISLVNRYGVRNWFFLDLSMPFFVKYALMAKRNEIDGFKIENLAVRYSEFEAIEYALGFRGMAKWVWVDCFKFLPLNGSSYEQLVRAGFSICVVSPELQGHPLDRIGEFRDQIAELGIAAVCTKRPDLWT